MKVSFEGILQLRNVSYELIDWLIKKIAKEKVAVAKTHYLANGIDFYIGSGRQAGALGKALSKSFNGILKTSRKLVGYDRLTNRKKYRVTVLFRGLNFKRGDKIAFRGERFEVLSINNQVLLKNLATGEMQRKKAELLAEARAI